MLKAKKSLFFIMVLMLAFVLFACGETTETTETTQTTEAPTTTTGTTTAGDTVAPELFFDEESLLVETDSATFDIDNYVSATDDVSATENITIEVTDWGGFDISVPGTYEVTVTATDEAGNDVSGTITITVQDDVLPPMMVGSVSPIEHLAGEDVNLTKDLSAVDNVDGTDVIFTVSDPGDYDNEVPGTYVVEITMSDVAGNESEPVERTIVVKEAYTRAEMTSADGEIIRHKALYNPQILNSQTDSGFNTAYDGHFVNVLSKDYLEWVLEYAPERLGAGVGWSIVAVTNADDEIVYVRHWNSGEAYMEDDALVSVDAMDWSTGTVANATNARYSSAEMGLMMANINQWVPEDGHVFIFINWTTIGVDGEDLVPVANTADMPRSMGANYIMNSDIDGDEVKDYALGRTLEILDTDLMDETVRPMFDPANPFPIISIEGETFATGNGAWQKDYTETLYLERYDTENPYDPLNDVTADDGTGTDISDQVSYKIYPYVSDEELYGINVSVPVPSDMWADFVDTPWNKADHELTVDGILSQDNIGNYYVVEYTVTANGYTDTAYRLLEIDSFDYLELYNDDDTAYSKVMGLEQRLAMNPDLVEFGAFDQTTEAIIFEQAHFDNLSSVPALDAGVAVVLNAYHEVQTVRMLKDIALEMDADGNWTSDSLTWASADLLDGITVPEGGYLLVYPQGLDNEVMDKAVRAYYNYDYAGEDFAAIDPINGLVRVELPIKVVDEVTTLVIDDVETSITVVENSKTALIHSPSLGGAGFRTEQDKAYLYDKAMYEAFLADSDVTYSFSELADNLGVPWFNNGVVMIFDENGDFVKARLGVGAPAEVHADGTFLFGDAITGWDLTVYDGSTVHGLLANIVSEIPENGTIMLFPLSKTSAVRNIAIETIWNAAYPGGGAIVDINDSEVSQADKDTLGFDATTFDATYFADLSIVAEFVSTVVDQAPKLEKPVISIDGDTLSWDATDQDGDIAQFDLYVDGQLAIENVGTLTDGTYTFDLRNLSHPEGTYDIQLRAITADQAAFATSVLSHPVSFTIDRLPQPTNFERTDNVLTWEAVTDATTYYVSINEGEYFEVTTNEVVIPYDDIMDGIIVRVYAAGAATLFDSQPADYEIEVEVVPKEITMGEYTLPVTEFTAGAWMNHASWDPGASELEGIIVVNKAEDLANYDAADRVFSGGYAAVLDADNNVKYIVDRWGHEWNATDGWTTDDAGWDYGANHYVSYFTPYLASGDKLIFASQYTTGLEVGKYRDYFGNALIQDFGTIGEWSVADHRDTNLGNAIDPTTVNIDINVIDDSEPALHYLTLNGSTQKMTITTAEEWIALRNTLVADGGYAGSTDVFLVEDAYSLNDLADTSVLFEKNATIVVLAADGTPKVIRTILNNHEWLASNDQGTNNGWTINGNYASGMVYVDELLPHLAEGDQILIGKSSATQDGATLSTRDFLAYHFMGSWAEGASEIWRNTSITADFIDPTTTTMAFETHPAETYLTIAGDSLHVKKTTADEYLTERQASFVGLTDIYLIEDVYDLTQLDDTNVTFETYATMVLFGADGTVKNIRSLINNIEYTADGGWAINGNYTSGTILVSEFEALLEEGDYILLGRSSSPQADGLLSARDFLAYHFMGSWDTSGSSNEIWRNTSITADFIDPNTTSYEIGLKPIERTVTLDGVTQRMTRTDATEYMAERQNAFVGVNDIFLVEDAYDLTELEDTNVVFATYATMVLVGADGTVKNIRSVVNNIEYTADGGWAINGNYTSGNIYVSEFESLLEEGDYILVARGSTPQDDGLLSPRDFLAYHFMGSWDEGASEIWRNTSITADFIDPNTAVVGFGQRLINPVG